MLVLPIISLEVPAGRVEQFLTRGSKSGFLLAEFEKRQLLAFPAPTSIEKMPQK